MLPQCSWPFLLPHSTGACAAILQRAFFFFCCHKILRLLTKVQQVSLMLQCGTPFYCHIVAGLFCFLPVPVPPPLPLPPPVPLTRSPKAPPSPRFQAR